MRAQLCDAAQSLVKRTKVVGENFCCCNSGAVSHSAPLPDGQPKTAPKALGFRIDCTQKFQNALSPHAKLIPLAC